MSITESDADELGEAADEHNRWQRWFSVVWLFILVVVIVGGVGLSYYVGIIQPEIAIAATVNVGWILEYFIAGILFTLLFVTIVAAFILAPGSLVTVLAQILTDVDFSAYLPVTDDDNTEQDSEVE